MEEHTGNLTNEKEEESKPKLEEQGTIMLTKNCSVILRNELPTKLEDPGSFIIPCELSESKFNKVFCDLGASINLMPLSNCRKLNLRDLKEPSVSLPFADSATKMPQGIIEDVLIKIGELVFPCDVILDMEVNWKILLILGRSFLTTTGTLIDVKQGKLTLRLNDQELVFDINQTIKTHPTFVDDMYYSIDTIEECANCSQ